MRCKYCGEIIEENYKYCISCGKPIQDTIDEYSKKKEEKQNDSIEYFEIENHEEEKNDKYDFSKFLYDKDDEELEEIQFSTKHEDIKEAAKEANEKKEYDEKINETVRQNFEDDLEDTKKRILFERSDYKFFDSIKRKNKENKEKDRIREQYNDDEDEKKEKKESFKEYRERSHNEYEELEKVALKNSKRKRFYKRIRNLFYNIIVGIGIWFLYTNFGNQIIEQISIRIPQLYYIDYRLVELGFIFIVCFLLAPFFICKGNAKIPLLFFSILTSWTIIGWIILIIIAINSNFKFKRGY